MSILRDIVKQQGTDLLLIVLGILGLAVSIVLNDLWFAVAIPIILCGIPIVYGAIIGLIKEHDITADVLVSVAIVASILIGEYEAAAEISVIMQIGSLLEEATVNRANSGITDLLNRRPAVARVISQDGETIVPSDQVRIGDVVRVVPGETIPVDGTVISGNSSVDTSMLTGESIPVDISEGCSVSSGTINMFGSVDIRVDRVGEDSTISRMARLLENADAGKSRIVRTADRWARWIVAIAFTVSVAAMVITGDVYRAVTVLVVFCPCALILATPTAIMAATGNLSRRGILVKDGAAMENMASVDTILMDKTGTFTTGKMVCLGFVSTSDIGEDIISRLSSSLEMRSEHPLGKAISDYNTEGSSVEDFRYMPGKGVYGIVDGYQVTVGNPRLMEEYCPNNLHETMDRSEEDIGKGLTVVYSGIDGKTVGYAILSDTIKDTTEDAIRDVKGFGLETIMLTGDSAGVATSVKESLGLDDVVWECLPEDKLSIIEKIGKGRRTCMVGDGLNDAPSLKRADVGIAMGGIGSDLAIEAADIIVADDDISRIPSIIAMSRRTISTIKAGIAFSVSLNTVAMVLAVLGIMGPIAGALVHNIGSVIVIIGAAMLLRYDCHPDHPKQKIADPCTTV